MYKELEKQAEKAFLELAREKYQDIVENEKDRTINSAWITALLFAYNAVTKYVFKHEVERKQARLAEAVIASDSKMQELITARNLWVRQVKQYTIDIEDAAMLAGYKTLGVKKVRWVAEIDGRECSICRQRNGKVYPLTKVPAKPHYNCRCYVVPVDKENEND